MKTSGKVSNPGNGYVILEEVLAYHTEHGRNNEGPAPEKNKREPMDRDMLAATRLVSFRRSAGARAVHRSSNQIVDN